MADPHILMMLGNFVLAWSLIESTIEVGIGKQLGTAPLETSIVTAGLMFKARAAILMSLLNRDPKKNEQALNVLKKIEKIEDRNDIMHSVVGGAKNQIWFNRRKTKRIFQSKIETYDAVRMSGLVLEVADLSVSLMKALGVDKDHYLAFFQQSHNAVNS